MKTLRSFLAIVISIFEPVNNFLQRKFTYSIIALADNSQSERQVYIPQNDMAAATAAAAAAAATSLAANNPMVNIPGMLDIIPIPSALTITHTSTNAGTAKTTYFGNTSTSTGYNPQPTDNDSGAASIVNTYGDGWSGRGYDQLFRSVAGGKGVRLYGFTMHFITTSTGAENSAGLTTANPTLIYNTNQGTSAIPKPISLNIGARNTQYLSGEMTVKTDFYMNCVSQVSYVLPINSTLSVTFFTQPLN